MTRKTQLIESSIQNGLAKLSENGALVVETGKFTGRAAKSKFISRTSNTESTVAWGKTNQSISKENSHQFFEKVQARLGSESTINYEGFVGGYPIRVTSTSPWHIVFCENMFRHETVQATLGAFDSESRIEIFHLPSVSPSELGLDFNLENANEALIVMDPDQSRVAIAGTRYAGEIKKSAFSICNYLLPEKGILPMHSSANCLPDGASSSVLFGLSGTGKTTLSACAHRALIGDDEIIWTDTGISNLEGGCYAKLIKLDESKEPEIYHAVNRFGSIMENVVMDEENRSVDFDDDSLTENTRGSYDIRAIDNVYDQGKEGGHPKSIIFLMADAFGAMPAVAKLNSWQTQFHFISGYTSKVAGTELGIKEPVPAFSACFGAPFMPRPAHVYAELLSKKCEEHGTSVWILNTGWTGGDFKSGSRFPIPVSRAILDAIQTGELEKAPRQKHPIFGFEVPTECPGVESKWLTSPEGPQVSKLAELFIQNAQKGECGLNSKPEIIDRGGPIVAR